MAEPEYSAFAVVTICAAAVNDDVEKLTKYVISYPSRSALTTTNAVGRHVKALVGEVDFSFHAVKTSKAGAGSLHESEDEKTKFD